MLIYVLFLSAEREKATKKRARCTLRVRTDYDSEKLCCGIRFAQTGPRTASASFFNHRICVPASPAIATNFGLEFRVSPLVHPHFRMRMH